MPAPTTRHLTILLTDIKGFTDKTSSKSRVDIQRLLDDHREVVLPVLQSRGGKLVKTIGDAFLMVFESPTDAVLAGVAAQDALSKRNEGLPEADRIEIRIAINSGEVNLVEGDVFGEPVNITARIEGVAEAGEVYFTEAVYLAMNKAEVPSSEVGQLQLKGIPEKVRVYKVRRETPLGVGQVPPKAAPAKASGFAPGEKARLVAAPGPVPASASAAAASASWKRRALALCVDGMLCSMLAGMLMGASSSEGPNFRVQKKWSSASADAPQVSVGPSGVTVRGEDGEELVLHEKDGFKVTARPSRRGRSLFPLGWFVYNFLFVWLLAGATPGKRLLGLRVTAEDGSPMDPRRAGLRAVMSLASGAVLMLGYAWALWDARSRTWHDLIAGTRVVRAEPD
jgi:class 3 adenylate cyclase